MSFVLRIFVFACLIVFLFFAIIYVFAGLPYFLQWFYTLLNCFFQPIAYICIFLLLYRFLPVPLPRFGQLLVHAFRFLLLFKMVHGRYSAFYLFFCLVAALLDAFCGSFCACFFCCVNQRVISIFTCSFSFFSGGVVCFFCFAFAYTQPYRTANPLLCHISPPVSSLTPSTILANYVLFSCP